ncbi:type IV pilus biogenesis/stability protein PilW [Psychromonas sp. MME2]|uniref:type IV pilus biogenesis/stability protein PilW n=1 Tax=unclassified Psychromonas TaxID=2614957 RepID=UPI00339C3581
MHQFFMLISCLFLLSACVSSETSVTTSNGGSGQPQVFDPQAAADTRIKLALLYLQKNDMQQAKKNIEKALEYQPNDANIYRVFAYYYQRVNEDQKAEELYKKSLSMDSKNPDTYNNYGTFLCEKARYAEAEKAFLTAVKQSSYTNVANTYENAGTCAEKAGDINKALFYYQYAISHNPNKYYLNLYLAKFNITLKNFTEARLNLFNYQKKNKASPELLWQLIRLSYATEKSATLNKYAGELLNQFPDSQQALDYLNHEYYE